MEAIRTIDPDILCLQEVPSPAFLTALKLPTRLYAPEGGLAIVSRLSARSSQTVTYDTCSALESYQRQVLLVELEAEGGSLWVATTHLSWRQEDTATRLGQTEELLNLTKSLGCPMLITGDLNASADQASIQKILAAGFEDLFSRLHPTEPGTTPQAWSATEVPRARQRERPEEPGLTWDNQNPFIQSHSTQFPDRRIDYLLLRQRNNLPLRPIQCEVACNTPTPEGIFPSDHYGVLGTFASPDKT